MSGLLKRAGDAAAAIYEERVITMDEDVRGHEITLRLLMAEAYTRGYVAGLERAQRAVVEQIEVADDELRDD
ncbi:MAG TPA: hypothetical protein VF339_18580 [Gammaproteobacteria bacterium]